MAEKKEAAHNVSLNKLAKLSPTGMLLDRCTFPQDRKMTITNFSICRIIESVYGACYEDAQSSQVWLMWSIYFLDLSWVKQSQHMFV